jgi:hypothetical protein
MERAARSSLYPWFRIPKYKILFTLHEIITPQRHRGHRENQVESRKEKVKRKKSKREIGSAF